MNIGGGDSKGAQAGGIRQLYAIFTYIPERIAGSIAYNFKITYKFGNSHNVHIHNIYP